MGGVVFSFFDFWSSILLETDHLNLTYLHGGTSPKVVRWSLLLQSFPMVRLHVPGSDLPVPDALSRAPRDRPARVSILLADQASAAPVPQFRSMVATPEPERFAIFESCHNSTQGHHGVHRTVEALRQMGHDWPRMTRDVTEWIRQCGSCQKIRGRESQIASITAPIGTFCIFEELSVDFIGPLPKDEVGNSYILNCVCSTTRYCELFAVEAATAVIAAHCILSVVCRYGCFRTIRSDQGTHFCNELIEEFLRLFEMRAIVTLAYRPQANGLAERNGGEVMRHLRALVLDKLLKPLWSVVLPMVMRIINKTFKQSINGIPHALIHWAPTNQDRGIFAPFPVSEVMETDSEYVKKVRDYYEFLCDATSAYVLREQDRMRARQELVEPTEFALGSYVLLRYPERPPSKLNCRWDGPYLVEKKVRNTVTIRDLTCEKTMDVDVSRLKPFLVSPVVDPKVLAAADMGELEVVRVVEHRGSTRNRKEMEFLVEWSDGETTWEIWEQVKKLTAVDEYIRSNPERGLKSLVPGKKKA